MVTEGLTKGEKGEKGICGSHESRTRYTRDPGHETPQPR